MSYLLFLLFMLALYLGGDILEAWLQRPAPAAQREPVVKDWGAALTVLALTLVLTVVIVAKGT